MAISELQKKIGALLMKGPKTADEIAEELGVDIHDVLDALKDLLMLRLVVKEGNPPRYSLSPHVKEAVEMDESGGILVHAVIEAEAVEEDILKRSLQEIVENLEKDGRFIVKHRAISDIEKDEETGTYYGHIDTTVIFPNLESIMYFLFYYGPSVVELLSTDKIEIDPGDLQRSMILAANMIHGYVTYISRLMTKKELEEFNKRMLKGF